MTVKELESYILAKPNAKKNAIPQWRYVRYTIYQSLFAALEEKDGKTYCSVYGKFPEQRAKYPACVLPAVELGKNFSSILMAGNIPDADLQAMIDEAYQARFDLIEKAEMGEEGSPDLPYGEGICLPKSQSPNRQGKPNITPHTVDTKFDEDIQRYADLRKADEHENAKQATRKEVAATKDDK